MATSAFAASLVLCAPAFAQPEAEEARPPRVLEQPELDALEGAPEVELIIVVEEDGTVGELSVGEVVAPDDVRERAIELATAYVARLRFEPALLGGRPARARVRYRVRFPEPPPAEADETDDAADAGADDAAAPVEGEPEAASDAATPAAGVEAAVALPERNEASAVSDLDIDVGALRLVPRDGAQAMLTLAPGILVTQVMNEGHTASIYLRGFDAAEGEDLEVRLAGIPLNEVSNAHAHGYVDTLVIVPELVRGLRVVQGPFDPAQGDFAMAGSAEYELGLRERGIHGQIGYGTYEQRRLALYWGPEGQEEGTFAGLVYNGGSGFGTNRAFQNIAAMAQYEGRAESRRLRYRLLVFGGAGSWDQAGVLREDDFQRRQLPCASDDFSQFYCTYDPRQGGSTSRLGGSVALAFTDGPGRFDALLFGMGRSLRIRENFTGFREDPRTDGGPQRGDLTDQRYDAATIGLRASYRRRFSAFDQPQQLEVGLYARQDFADTALDRVRAELDVPYATDFDRNLSITNVAAYLRFDLRFTEWLSVMFGARADAFNFRVIDRNFPDMDRIGERLPRSTSDAFGFLVQPRGSVRVRFVEGLSWITSVGLGARSSDAAAVSDGELAPFAEVIAGETGLALEAGDARQEAVGRGFHLTGGLSGFYTRVTQDLVFDAAAGRNTVTGPSNRTGATATARFKLDHWLDAQLSVTYTRAHLPPVEASPLDLFAGPRLPYIPEFLGRLDVAASHTITVEGEPLRGSVAVGALYLSPRPLPLEQWSEPWFVLDAAASLRWRWVELGVSAQNLLDLRYRAAEFHYVSNFGDPNRPPSMMAQRHFAAAPPLRVMVHLTIHVQLDAPWPWPASASAEPPVTRPPS